MSTELLTAAVSLSTTEATSSTTGLITSVSGTNSIWNNYSAPSEWIDFGIFKLTAASTKVHAIFQTPNDGGLIYRAEFTGTFTKTYAAGVTLSAFMADSPGVCSQLLLYEDDALIQNDSYSPAMSPALVLTADRDASLVQLQQLYSGDDVFVASTRGVQDGVIGYDGNDFFYGHGSVRGTVDYFNGDEGIDTSVYRGKLADYTISSSAEIFNPASLKADAHGFMVVDSVASRDGATGLTNVERLEFTDYNVALDTDSANSAGGIYRLYQAAFDREPDLSGLGYWIHAADNGKSAVEMAEDFTWSKEFLDLFHLSTPKDNYFTGVEVKTLVEGMYTHVLHRAADAGGLNYYAGVIASHEKTVGRVLAEISDSPENHTAVASSIANGIQYTPYTSTPQTMHLDDELDAQPQSLSLNAPDVYSDPYQPDVIGQTHDPMYDWMWMC